jgi:hypothetical protein
MVIVVVVVVVVRVVVKKRRVVTELHRFSASSCSLASGQTYLTRLQKVQAPLLADRRT